VGIVSREELFTSWVLLLPQQHGAFTVGAVDVLTIPHPEWHPAIAPLDQQVVSAPAGITNDAMLSAITTNLIVLRISAGISILAYSTRDWSRKDVTAVTLHNEFLNQVRQVRRPAQASIAIGHCHGIG
jgi:hypothetical protein